MRLSSIGTPAYRIQYMGCGCVVLFALVTIATPAAQRTHAAEPSIYSDMVLEDGPAMWWRMSRSADVWIHPEAAATATEQNLRTEPVGEIDFSAAGPAGEELPDFATDNTAMRLEKGPNYLRIADPGDGSLLDFDNGDSITLEAWIKPLPNPGVGYGYILGKGRTRNAGDRNQNYSLRLAYGGGSAKLSFYFVDAETPESEGSNADGHRWNSSASLPLDDRWHHVAVAYTFGEPDSIRGYIDGEATNGRWDLAGATKKRPVVDNDDLWIGSSMKGRATFRGDLDEVAVYRKALPADTIMRHANIHRRDEIQLAVESVGDTAPEDRVAVDVFEGIPDSRDWTMRPTERRRAYETDVFAITDLPRKYNDKAVIVDRKTPLLIHAYAQVTLPAGKHRLLLRSLNAARLYIDDEPVMENDFLSLAGNGHNAVYKLQGPLPDRVSLPAAHKERIIEFVSDGEPHLFSLLTQVGHANRPAIIGELVVAVADEQGPFRLLCTGHVDRDIVKAAGSADDAPNCEAYGRYDDEGWLAFRRVDAHRRWLWQNHDRERLGAAEREYWRERHVWVREQVRQQASVEVPDVEHAALVNNDVDRFIQSRLEAEQLEPATLVDDLTFLRRVTLDVTGVIPTPDEIEHFLADPPESRRSAAIDRLLASPGWADHWVGYWQHVLAENPGLTKPTLNNSGPFRWFVYESFLDNKPFDRFVTELLSMEGGSRSGGPAGFALATNNDVPMAAKAHVVGSAFLGVEMKCARCHDAPLHDSTQEDLFSLAAMLGRKPQAVPASSTVPGTPEQLANMVVTVSLKPGVPVDPEWPFEQLASPDLNTVPNELRRDGDDTRDRLAWYITHPDNRRFAHVVINRMWQRYLGRGLVEPIHDWEAGDCSHPMLLEYLADELAANGYDLKHVARLIFNSQAYQREVKEGEGTTQRQELFASPTRRRYSAEQLADSIYQTVGKTYDVEPLTMNADGRQVAGNFLDLGRPRRAWQFACTSNERERPSMTLPRAQAVVDLLMAYGWSQNRQEPINERVDDATPLTALLLANGTAVNRAVDLSDNGCLVELCLEDQPAEQLVERLFVRFLGREPREQELAAYSQLLEVGYDDRATGEEPAPCRVDRSPLTWSNNLDAEANRIGLERQKLALQGDAPTRRLQPEWRERVEDMVWVLLNSPEFVFVP